MLMERKSFNRRYATPPHALILQGHGLSMARVKLQQSPDLNQRSRDEDAMILSLYDPFSFIHLTLVE